MRIGSLFSGIGGLELGLEMAGLGPVVWQCETDPFCRLVLEKHWPGVERYGDIRELTDPPAVDLTCGGFPCQDISSAGKGAGLAGERSGLWFEFARVVGESRPRWVVVENVASGAKRWVDQVCSELGQLGYGETLARFAGEDGEVADTYSGRQVHALRNQQEGRHKERGEAWDGCWGRPVVPAVCRVDDGIPNRVDRLRALGNAVVPQCAEVIGWVIRELDGAVAKSDD